MSQFSDAQKEYLDELFLKLSTSINKKFAEVANQISEIKEEISETTKAYESRIEQLTVKNKKLEKEVAFLQKKVRKNNIVIYGISVDHNENEKICEGVISILNQLLEINLDKQDISDVYKLGKNKDNQPILVELVTYRKKKLILSNVRKLRGKNVFIAEDQSWEDREKTKILVRHLNKYKAEGKKVQIRGSRLIIENQAYSLEELENNVETGGEEEVSDDGSNIHASVTEENLPTSGNISRIKGQPQRTKPDETKSNKVKPDFIQKKNLRSTTTTSKNN